MRKYIIGILMLILSAAMSLAVFAETEDAAEYAGRQVAEAVPEDACEIMDEKGITPENGALGLTFEGVLSDLLSLFKDRAEKPLKLLCALCGTVLMCALAESMNENGSSVFSAVGVLCGAGIVAAAMYDILNEALGVLSSGANFTLIFIPTFAALSAALGHITAAGAINSAVIAATQLFSQLCANFLAPMCGAIVGLSAAGAVCPKLKTDKLGAMASKFVVWGLTLIMTVFMSILSVQTLVANASDNTAIKTAKFMVSQGVPIVGGTISDAVNTLSGGLSIAKGSIGAYGIIAAAVIVIPPIIGIVCYKLALGCAQGLAEMFGLKEIAGLFKGCGGVMNIILAVTAGMLVLNTVAALMLAACCGT